MSVTRQTQSDVSPASETVEAGTPITGLDDFSSVIVFVTLQGATDGPLDVFLQSFDGVNWVDVVHFPQLLAAASVIRFVVALSREPRPDAAPIVVGLDLTPALAANVAVHGTLTDRLRLTFDAGASTTAGAAQVLTVTGTETRLEDLQEQDLDLRVR